MFGMKSWNVALLGECMVEVQEAPCGCTMKFGGDTLNTAVYFARLGAPFGLRVEYVTALGDDELSGKMMAFWEKEGVRSSLVRRIPGKLPGLYYISLLPHGERVFNYWRGESAARECFESCDADAVLEELAAFDCIYCSGISLAVLREKGREKLLARLAELAAMGKFLAFDCNYRPRLWGDSPESALAAARKACSRIVAISDTVLLTKEEMPLLGIAPEMPLEEQGRLFAALHPAEFVVKDGKEACLVWRGCVPEAVLPDAQAPVVDTTAAGDSYAAAYLLARHLGYPSREAAGAAHKLAQAVIAQYGAIIERAHMPDIFAQNLPGHPAMETARREEAAHGV
jgi:2-dehydro-3-deoxygluconokinase